MTTPARLPLVLVLPALAVLMVASAACTGNDGGTSEETPVTRLTPRPRPSRTPGSTVESTRTPRGTRTPQGTGTPGEETPTPTETSTSTETPTGTAEPSRTPRTPGDPGEQYDGSPISGNDIEGVLFDAGFDIESPESGTVYPGFSREGFTVVAEKDGTRTTLVIFVYPSPEELQTDWDATVGERPAPKDGREPPAFVSAWWNNNTVVLVTESPDAAQKDELFEAYIELP